MKKIIQQSSLLAAACTVPFSSAALRGAGTTAASSSEVVNVATSQDADDASSLSSLHRKLPYDSSGNWYWNYEGYTYTTSGTYETRYCYYAESNNYIGPLYDTMLECCQANFAQQTSNMCVSKLPNQPSAAPSIGLLGLPQMYVPIHANGVEDGYCSNLKEDVKNVPEGQIYETEYQCCAQEFPNQPYCLSQIDPNDPTYIQPSGAPSLGGELGLPNQYVAVHTNGYDDGYCSNLKEHVFGTPESRIYESEFECCQANFADQTTGTCISYLPDGLQPSGAPSLSGTLGLPNKYVAVFTNGYEDGYCSNLKEHVIGTPEAQIYESEFECCQANFADQTSGTCIAGISDALFPSGAPSLSGTLGLPNKYVAVFTNGYEDGYCSNLKEHVIGTPEAQIYESEFECCQANFGFQTSGTCIAGLSEALFPSGAPSLSGTLGLPNKYVAVHTNGYEDGYCSNLKEHVIGTPEAQIYESEFECCQANFADQTSGTCIAGLSDALFPSGAPSLSGTLGLPNKYVAVHTNGYEDGYCSNLKEHVIGTPEAQIYESEFECCQANFADQTTGTCIAGLSDALFPSGAPSLSGTLGLPNKYVAVFANGYEDGYCSNLKEHVIGTPEAQIYESEFECCQANFGFQTSGTCIAGLSDALFPSGAPSLSGTLGLPNKYVAVHTNGYEDGYCSNLKEHVIGTPEAQIYESEFECCQANFADQTTGTCIAGLSDALFPSGAPSLSGTLGLPNKYVAVHTNGYEDGYCSNLKEHVIGTPEAQIYESEFECCQANFADQTTGTCIAGLSDALFPSGAPSLSGTLGLPNKYVAVFANGYEDGYCSNLKEHVIGTPEAQIYESEFECCQANFADQTTGTCIAGLSDALFPSGAPSLSGTLGLPNKYVAVFANGYEDGYCSNLKEHVIGTPEAQIYESEFECCQANFADQTTGTCIAGLSDALFPSGAPSLSGTLGLPNKYVAVHTNGYEDGYCSNLKEHVIGTPEAQIYESEFECCQANFADQTTGTCIAGLPEGLQPSGAPSLDNNGQGGLDVWVPKWMNSYNDGYCSNKKEDVQNSYGTPFDSAIACCQFWFGLQDEPQTCITSLAPIFGDLQPSGAPSITSGGLPDKWAPVYGNGWELGYCSNLKEHVKDFGSAMVKDTQFECCEFHFKGQTSGYCTSKLPDGLQPSGAPSIDLMGLPEKYVAVHANGYEDGYCSNLKADVANVPDARIYETEYECCNAEFRDQSNGYCLSQIDPDDPTYHQPSGAPSLVLGGLADMWVPVWPASNSYENGFCSNKKEYVYAAYTQPMESHIECCLTWFRFQSSQFCISEVEDQYQPTSSPTITGGGYMNAKFFPRFPGVGIPPATENYCDNDHKVLPLWQLANYDTMGFDTQDECCDAWFPELGTACTRRPPTFGTLVPTPSTCEYYPKHEGSWELGTCVNDCNHPHEYEDMLSTLMFSNDKAGGMECCNTWFENNGLTQQQIGSGRLSYCLTELQNANPSYGITAPPTRAPV